MCNTCVIMGFTIAINLFKYKKFKDGRCTYKNTRSSHLKLMLQNTIYRGNNQAEVNALGPNIF